jgi:uncharacterized repeat protein (TIGR01451 family)
MVVACSLLGGLLVAAVATGLHPRARGRVETSLSRQVVINEVAWMGTEASAFDEWIELHNTTSVAVSLAGWCLVDDDDLSIPLSGEIPPQGTYLIERTDDAPVGDIAADWFDTFGRGGLSNAGEVLTLTDGLGNVVDTANADGGAWPAGIATDGSPRYATMERADPTGPDEADNWCTNDGVTRNGVDAAGGPINGTPKARNSCYRPPAVPTANLSVTKRGPSTVRAGDRLTYQIALTNTGTISASQTVLTDTLPAAIAFVTQTSPFTFSSLGRHLVWQLGDVPPGATYRITAVGRVSPAATDAAPAAALDTALDSALGSALAGSSDPAVLVNLITATTTTTETTTHDNSALCTTTLDTGYIILLPLILHQYTPPPYEVLIEALLYDGLQAGDQDEAVLLLNGGYRRVDLAGWELCKGLGQGWACADLPSLAIGPGERLWLARSGIHFARSFGFPLEEDQVLAGWPGFRNDGDEVALRDDQGLLRDVLVYEGGLAGVDGWVGLPVQPCPGTSVAEEGQILYRRLDEALGRPAEDTDTAVDWAQYHGDPWQGRRVRYPGWDLERFFQPAVEARGHVTVGVAPDNAYQLVVDTIRSARERIEIEAYSLEHPGLVAELVERARQGVSVTALLEGGPVGGVADQELWACQELHATGRGACHFMVQTETPRIYPRYRYVHAKMMIVDRERLLVSSQNLVHTSLPGDDKGNGTGGSRGVVLVTDAPGVVARAVEVFEADCDPDNHVDVSTWGPDNLLGYGSPPPGFTPDPGADWVTYTVQFPDQLTAVGAAFELLTAPEAALRNGDGLLGLVARAGAGDAICAQQLYERPDWGDPLTAPNLRLRAYLDAARRGARVRLLLNGGTFDTDTVSLTENIEAAAYVNEIAQAEGLDLSAHLGDPTQYGIHNKMVLVDLGSEGKYAHVGSINGSEVSNKLNREMALQVRSAELFDYLYDVFAYDWSHQPPQGHVLISEVLYDADGQDAGQEWVELYNPTTGNVDLSGWYVGDVGPDGEYGSGLYRFPNGATLVAEGVIVLAHQASDVAFTPDYEFLVDPHRDDPAVPNLVPTGAWDGFGLALGNDGDEVLLLDASGAPVDVVTYGDGAYPGVVAHPGVGEPGHSLERRPLREDTDDCGHDFFDRYPPTPGVLPE